MTELERFPVYVIGPEERTKADNDPHYAPIETTLGYIMADHEDNAEVMLKRAQSLGRYPARAYLGLSEAMNASLDKLIAAMKPN